MKPDKASPEKWNVGWMKQPCYCLTELFSQKDHSPAKKSFAFLELLRQYIFTKSLDFFHAKSVTQHCHSEIVLKKWDQNLICSISGYETITCSRQNYPPQISLHSSSDPVAVVDGAGGSYGEEGWLTSTQLEKALTELGKVSILMMLF